MAALCEDGFYKKINDVKEAGVPIKLKKEYLNNIRERYRNSTKKKKSAILSEFCVNSGYSRKHASRILSRRLEPRLRRSGPKLARRASVFEETPLV